MYLPCTILIHYVPCKYAKLLNPLYQIPFVISRYSSHVLTTLAGQEAWAGQGLKLYHVLNSIGNPPAQAPKETGERTSAASDAP